MEPILITLYTEYTKLLELHTITSKKLTKLAELIGTYGGDPDSVKELNPELLAQVREDIKDSLYPIGGTWEGKITFMMNKFPNMSFETTKIVEFLYNNEGPKFRSSMNKRDVIAAIVSKMVKTGKLQVDKSGTKSKYFLP